MTTGGRIRYAVLLTAIGIAVVVAPGHAMADGGDDSHGTREVATVRFIDRDLNLVQLQDGTELHTNDARLLLSIKEGMRVLVDFTHSGDTNELNSIAPVDAVFQPDK